MNILRAILTKMINAANLSHDGLIKINGQDAQKFLQGQLTCNMNDLDTKNFQYGAHCNPKGRIISFFKIIKEHHDFYLSLPKASVATALNALKKYAVFFKVNLADISDEIKIDNLDQKKITELGKGIPAIYPETSEKFLPQEINLTQIDAVSFNKGCYTGQEIIARLQYRGQLKTKLYRGQLSNPMRLVRGGEIYSHQESSGTIVDFAEFENQTDIIFIAPNDSNSTFFVDFEKQVPLVCVPFEPLN